MRRLQPSTVKLQFSVAFPVCRLAPAAALHQFINARIGAFQSGVARRAAAHAADSRCGPHPQQCITWALLVFCSSGQATASSSLLHVLIRCTICLLPHPLETPPLPGSSTSTSLTAT